MSHARTLIIAGLILGTVAGALAEPCVLPDVGGTVDLPPACPDGYQGMMEIVDGLPPGTTIAIDARLADFANQGTMPGGDLGGEIHQFEALLHWTASGTGQLAGFQRTLSIWVDGEIHTAPRIPGDPEQVFAQQLFILQGEQFGDPDFCTLRVRAGNALGLPSPGQTTLTRLPDGNFNVDSFFDITYQIEFEGCPGSILEDLAGTTTATERFQAGEPYIPVYPFSCVLPDNGTGTVDLPPDCPDGYQGPMDIVDGLPPGTTIGIDAQLGEFFNVNTMPGGDLGGEVHQFEAILHWTASGTGELAGFQRNLSIWVEGEIHTAPRTPGDPEQIFAQQLFFLQGELFGDPDFCTLRVRAGNAIGLPSPGQTTLTRLPDGNFNVDSFFDITYQIEFEGCPSSILEDLAGTTTATRRFQAGEPYVPLDPYACVLPDNGTGTVDLPPNCPDGYQGPMEIVDGLPPGTTIAIVAELGEFTDVITFPGGELGGEIHQFIAILQWSATGNGELAGFQRTLSIWMEGEIHTAPRIPGDPVQIFAQQVYRLQGELFGDPDFCTLRVRAGNAVGLPGPGQTTLTRLPSGDFNVDSFFDITYQIEFEGCPDSILGDLAGTTTASERFQAGEPYLVAVDDRAPTASIVLHQNVPNPFNPETVIAFDLGRPGRVTLVIYDLAGRHVRTLVDGHRDSGRHEVAWRGRDDHGARVASGVYFSVLRGGGRQQVRKMAVIE